MIDRVWQDLRYTVRSLTKAPLFALAAIATLALGIGANAALFSVADATALRPPDVPNPGELVRVFTSTKDSPYGELPYPDYQDFRREARSVSGLVAYESADFALSRTRDASASYVGGWLVSANFFSVLGVEPALGRGFRPEEDGSPSPVAVISHRLWEREFASDAGIVGQEVLVSGAPFTIVGVTPESFGGTDLFFHPDVFIPLASMRMAYPNTPPAVLEDRLDRWLTVLGRLAPGVSADDATAEFTVLGERLARQFPDTNRDRRVVVLPEMTARVRLDQGGADGVTVILGLVGLVLLLACANVSNLVLSRNALRVRDVALRAAMGATRAHLIRQSLTESALLAVAGGAAAVLVGGWAIAYLSRIIIIPSALPLYVDFRLDARVIGFTAAATFAAAVLTGLIPALQASRASLSPVIKQRPDPLPRRVTARTALVVVQLAISVLVLVAAGLLVQAAGAAQRVDPGFRRDRVLLLSFNPGLVRYDSTRTTAFYQQIVERVRELPGVEAVGLTRFLPLGVSSGSMTLLVDGTRTPEGQGRVSIAETVVDPGYWRVMRTPILQGRAFDDRDTAISPRVAVVNETFAAQFWPGENPLGKTVRIPDVPGPNGARQTHVLEVVGIASDGKYWQLAEATRPFIYRPVTQSLAGSLTMTVLARESADAIVPGVRAAVTGVDANVPMFDVTTFDSFYHSRPLLPSRVMARIVSALGVLSLLLASIGLYAVIAFLFARRTQEIGIRIAVGASPGQVVRMVLRQAAVLVIPGLTVGLVLAAVLTPLLASPAFDFVTPANPLVMTLAAVTMAAVAFAAATLPALRASRIDPVTALRTH
jgi:predicted permease